jgi:hypothetical protein
MTNDSNVHHLTAVNLVVGTSAAPKHRRRRRSLASTLKAARKAGAGHVELVEDKVVIALTSEPPGSPDRNEWDELLPGGDRGAH